ncbi:nonsense-mediated mRNA decay factor SMG8-like isoform X2 [Mya arenaria]|uniref:nonsense-mediated mRNA decay factor SMG8-like isoform X2 n=1 Tax=Mya arenaria TaxID=6604 RepID=UPI0022E3F702|nr:nonsense-mediated mRNA decay factor SMG8-like isoform X2 [Mya arenaria]
MSYFPTIGTTAINFPTPDYLLPHSWKENKVCVVSIIGKSGYQPFTSKASPFNNLLDADVFKEVKGHLQDAINQGEIECYFDGDNNVVYLHHTSVHDTYRLVTAADRLSNATHKDFQQLWQHEECHYAKSFLFLFQISHLIVISHPGSSFDVTYVRLFRILDTIRMKVQKCVQDQLMDLPISKDWKYNGRPCSPRVLFVFETATLDYDPDEMVETVGYRPKPQKISPIKRLQHCMEDQIYKILRKSRVITNISNNSLFAVPANQEFVFIHVAQNHISDPVLFFLQQLRENTTQGDAEIGSTQSKSFQSSRSGTSLPGERSRSSPLSRGGGEFSFKEFLWQHIDMALTKGFDDNVGRHPVAANFELATSQTWFLLANRLYSLFFSEKLDPKIQPHCNTLKSLLETDLRFSENRCNKVLPMAESAYQENLPTHYVTAYHLSKLAQAKKVFSQFARGPGCDKYVGQLEESCERFWRNGRQLCEEVSLTGNHCVNPLHRTDDDPETLSNSHLPCMSHSSQLKMVAACNCGRSKGDREDPFTHKTANFDFYEKLKDTCCGQLESYKFPTFQPSTSDIRAAAFSLKDLSAATQKLQVRDDDEKVDNEKVADDAEAEVEVERDGDKTPDKDSLMPAASKADLAAVTQGTTNLSLALSLGQSGGGADLFVGGHQSNCSPLPDQDAVSNPDHTDAHTPGSPDVHHVSSPVRQHSTTEYLPGMIHTDSPSGLLPKFPSWSLVCLGKSTTYNQNQGLDMPGFLPGSNFLLPWDVTVQAERDKWPPVGETGGKKDKWPTVGETGKKGKQKKSSRGKEMTELALRVFVGEEYECPRGHRFCCSGPEKIIKVSSTSSVKDNANKLINMDMPLYCPCLHCRSSKGYMAQLMRIYIVTPDGPLQVSVNPLVQPAPHPCPTFHPGVGGEVDLTPGSIWVLRLPSVYMGDSGPYTIPSDIAQLPACRLLKGTFNFKEMQSD